MRLDKFLKVSRLIKRRTVANEACDAGRVSVNGKPAKASANVKQGDIISEVSIMFNFLIGIIMKKVLYVAAIFAAFGVNMASASNATVNNMNLTVSVVNQDPYKAIEVDELPQAVKDALAKDYKEMTIKAAYVKETEEAKTYKVTLVNADAETTDVLFNEKGEVLPNEEQI